MGIRTVAKEDALQAPSSSRPGAKIKGPEVRAGGRSCHGLLDDEMAEIETLYQAPGEIDRSHRNLAHLGSYTNRVSVAPPTVRRVLTAPAGCAGQAVGYRRAT